MPFEGLSLVDVHAHFVTPWYVEAALAAGHEHPDGMPGWPDWSVDDHLRLMDERGIDQAVLSISSPGVHFGDDAAAAGLARQVNDFAARVCADRPDRFRFFASLPLPALDESMSEMCRSLDELGAAGIVTETNIGGTYLSDPVFEPLFAELDRRGAILFVHPTSPPAHAQTALGLPRPMLEFLVETTRAMTGLLMDGTLERNPRVQVIASHCGAFLPLVVDRLKLFASAFGNGESDPPAFEDTLRRLWYDMAGTPTPTHAETLISRVGSGRLLYGSDFCWTPPTVVARQIAALDADWNAERHGPWRELAAANADALLSRGR